MKRITLLPVPVLMFAVLASGVRPALAQVAPACGASVCITPAPGPYFGDFATALGRTPEQLQQDLITKVDGLFQASNVGPFLKDFQNAQSFSTKGLGVDYASEATLVEAGATLSFASNIDKAYKSSGSYSDPPVSGGGGNFSFMGGVGLGLLGIDPVMVFGNWFKGSASLGQLEGSYHNWGLHAQIRLFGPSRKSSAVKFLVRWGGIAITSGADYSRLSLSTSKQVRSTINIASAIPGGLSQQVDFKSDVSGTLRFTLEQTTWSIPLEITTSLRLLSLVTVYGGIGMDWQLGGGSDMHIHMENAEVRDKASDTLLGTVSVKARGHASPSPARLREIVGVQLGLFDVVRFFMQVNVSSSSPMLASLAGGLRLAY